MMQVLELLGVNSFIESGVQKKTPIWDGGLTKGRTNFL
jgi:hypothetical protein